MSHHSKRVKFQTNMYQGSITSTTTFSPITVCVGKRFYVETILPETLPLLSYSLIRHYLETISKFGGVIYTFYFSSQFSYLENNGFRADYYYDQMEIIILSFLMTRDEKGCDRGDTGQRRR